MLSANRLSQNTSKSPSEVRLVEVLDAYLAAAQDGTAPARDVLLAEHPELAEDLEACLASLEFIRQASLSAPPLVTDSKAVEASEGETGIGDLGDFRLIAEVGRGGMGVVYEAVQRSLNRRVALKVLPFAAAMDPTQLRRFQTEALAAAQLHHTHIVPVYSVGCERGVHYYAMQFIEGQTLAQAIAERRQSATPPPPTSPSPLEGEGGPKGRMRGEWDRPGTVAPPSTERDTPAETPAPRSPSPSPSFRTREYFRTAATLGIQAAEALDHAHKFGIVHRDIKPANLLLDVQGNLWITDFGLARLQDDVGLTITGDLLGTLRYMSPEQALGKRGYLDHRTDIYSLGATLYELVTLRPAIDGEDRQEVLRKIAQDDPAPPRRFNPAVPSEMETILLKAMSKEPGSRYATAQELADDLRRFLDDKPIRARRPTLIERTAKWGRRHRMVVAVAVFILLFASVTLATSTVLIARNQREVEKQRDEARQAVDDMYTDVATEWLAQQAALQPMQQKFLQKALNYYQKFAGDTSTDANVRLRTGVAYRRVGEIQDKLGHFREAESACRKAARIVERLLADNPSVRAYQYDLAITESTLGSLLWATGPRDEANVLTRRSIARLEKFAADAPSEPLYRHELANSHMLLARFLWKKDPGEAESALLRAIVLLEKLAADSPSNPQYRHSLAEAYATLGLALRDIGRHADARHSYQRAIALGEQLVFEQPSVPEYTRVLARSLDNFAQLGGSTLDASESEQLYRRAIELEEKMVAGSPSVPSYRELLANTHGNLGLHLMDRRPKDGEQEFRRSVSLHEKLAADLPSAIPFQSRLASTRGDLGFLLQRMGRLAEAEQEFRSVISLAERLATDVRSAPEFQRELGISSLNLAKLLRAAGRPVEAEQEARRGVAMLEKLSEYPSLGTLSWFLATGPFPQLRDPQTAIRLAKQALEQRPQNGDFLAILGAAHYRAGEWRAASEAMENSIKLPSRGEARYWFFLAMACWRKGDKQKASVWYGEAVQRMEKVQSWDEEEARSLRDEAASLLGATEHAKSTERKEQDTSQNPRP